jgi:hypothetical protein
MSRLSRVSENSEESSAASSSKAPNFSRPYPTSYDSYESGEIIIRDRRPPGNVHAISAFHDPNRDLPDEPRFSGESERTQTINSDNSAGSDFAWDGKKGELVARPRKKQYDGQRYTGQPRSRPTTAKTHKSDKSDQSDNSISAYADARTSNSTQHSKKVCIDEQSDLASLNTNDQYEDERSHHTISDDEDEPLSFDSNGEWKSSDYDTTGLSDAKIKKLLKKGVNPSLYAEMQAAKKKGKSKWIGPLIGNSFIS